MIFAPAADPNEVSAYCESSLTDARAQCSDTVSSVDGETYTWTVTKPGQYELEAIAPAKKKSFLPQLILKDAAGEELANELGGVGSKAVATVDVKAGTYELTVLPGDGYMVKGGFSFELAIKSLNPEPSAPVAEGAAPAPVARAEKKAVVAKKAAPAPAPKPMLAKPAPKTSTVAAAPVATKSSNKNMDD